LDDQKSLHRKCNIWIKYLNQVGKEPPRKLREVHSRKTESQVQRPGDRIVPGKLEEQQRSQAGGSKLED
jgi:hypothetical protein